MSIITKDLDLAMQILNKNEVVAIPTETVYGLAANAFNEEAINKIFAVKKRPLFNPLIVHIKNKDYLETVAQNIPALAFKLIDVFWPGPLTLILEKQSHVPDLVTSKQPTVAVRMPSHPLTLALLEKLDYPLAAPSANPFKGISSTSAKHVYDYFKDDLKCIVDGGDCEKGLESTIIGFVGEKAILYRHGAIAVSEIEKITGELDVITTHKTAPTAPGMLLKHYSPKTKLILTEDVSQTIKDYENEKVVVLSFYPKMIQRETLYHYLAEKEDFQQAASQLYASLHYLDTLNLDLIIAEKLPNEGLGKTINDRLTRAAST